MNTDDFLNQMTETLALGKIVKQPERVTGGLTHKMYKVITETGTYIVKLLNPNIMIRPTAIKNYKNAEKLENLLKENNIDAIYALEWNHKKMQVQDEQYYYVYNWYDGKSLKDKMITSKHCEIIGKSLASIHNISITKEEWKEEKKEIDWEYYKEIAKEKNPFIYEQLSNNLEILNKSMNEGNQVIDKLPGYTAICHNDLDSKNVLWIGNESKIIDLECLNISNPYLELFITALCWSGYESCNLDYELLRVFINSYFQYSKLTKNIDWEKLYYANNGRLEWLEYNLKRALMLETNSTEEQQLGMKEVEETMNHILYYESIKDQLLNFFHSQE